MFTIVMMIVAAYAAIVLDAYLLDAKWGERESLKYYLTEPWQTVKRAGTVAGRAAASLWARVQDAVESQWNKLTD